MHTRCAVAVGFRIDLDIFGDHVGRIESQPEMADNPVPTRFFIFVDEVCGTGKRDLSDILFDFLFRHADSVILNGQGPGFGVRRYRDAVLLLRSGFSEIDKFFMLGDRVLSVCDDLPEEDVLFRIQPLFDDGHHVFAGNADITLFFHKLLAPY